MSQEVWMEQGRGIQDLEADELALLPVEDDRQGVVTAGMPADDAVTPRWQHLVGQKYIGCVNFGVVGDAHEAILLLSDRTFRLLVPERRLGRPMCLCTTS